MSGELGSASAPAPEVECPTRLSEVDRESPAENDQTASDTSQTLEDVDQSASDSDQTSADRDQDAADSDQAASDHDLASGVNREAHEFSRNIRQHSARKREQTARERLQVAEQRDAAARLRDLSAVAREQSAVARDLAMTQLDAASAWRDVARARTGVELIGSAAESRATAASQRLLAAEDREAAARDRELAAVERHQALRDRQALAAALNRAAVDEMTGARTRAAGLLELEHELDRTRRAGSTLAVIYIDVVGLKVINDALGHQAGDTLLERVVAALRAHLRPYDLIVRVGGDEFLCAMSNSTADEARERFQVIAAAIGQAPDHGKIRTGFAQSNDIDESVADLVARADRELIEAPGEDRSDLLLTGPSMPQSDPVPTTAPAFPPAPVPRHRPAPVSPPAEVLSPALTARHGPAPSTPRGGPGHEPREPPSREC